MQNAIFHQAVKAQFLVSLRTSPGQQLDFMARSFLEAGGVSINDSSRNPTVNF